MFEMNFMNGEQPNCLQIPAGSGMPESGELHLNLCRGLAFVEWSILLLRFLLFIFIL
jgi:hypothetical protein